MFMRYHYGLGVGHAYSHESWLAHLPPVQEEEFIGPAPSPPLNPTSSLVGSAPIFGTAASSSRAPVPNPLSSNVQVPNANPPGCNPSNATSLSTTVRDPPRGHYSLHSATLEDLLEPQSHEDADSNDDHSSDSGSSIELTSDEDDEDEEDIEDDAFDNDEELVAEEMYFEG